MSLTIDTKEDRRSRSLSAFERIATRHNDDSKSIFDTFDSDKDGFVTIDDIKKILESSLGEALDEEELKDLMNSTGVKSDEDKISFTQFQLIMQDGGALSPTSIRKASLKSTTEEEKK